ncbi:cytochrome P450 [Streptomyces sp. NPDC018019]|uniref:cytochrome P450 n=1 Tax=Streptomyces sp. NPDC018019 TaxID=3365030 RepID=UPI003789DBC1
MRNSVPEARWVTAGGALPLLGHSGRLLREPFAFLSECRRNGDLVKIRVGPRPAVLVCRADLAHEVLIDQAHHFEKGGVIFEHLRPISGNGLFTVERPAHLRDRRRMQPAFTRPAIDGYAPIMSEEAQRLSDALRGTGTADIKAQARRATIRILIRSIFPTARTTQVERFLTLLDTVFAGVYARIAVPIGAAHRLPLPHNRRFQRALALAWETAEDIVKQAREHSGTATDAHGFLPAFMRSGGREGEPGFTDAQLRDQVMSLLLAGSENAATVVGLACHHLAHAPRAERRVHAEVDDVLADRAIVAGDIPRLPHTMRTVTEILRMYPPVWALDRRAQRPVDLGGRRLRPGTDLVISPYLFHHDPVLFPDPERFAPDRWEPGALKQEARDAFIPFGAGSRKCLGDNFGMAEAVILLAALARDWRLRPAPATRVRIAAHAPLTVKGLWMTATPRHPATGAPPPPRSGTVPRPPNGPKEEQRP